MENEINLNNEQIKDDSKFVSLVNVNKIYDKNVHAVYDFNLDIKKNEFIAFVGPSGCGKSTTLRMIAGLEEITSGELYIDGVLSNDLLSKSRDIAMVFQSYALYPNMTVYDNMAFSLKVRHVNKNEIRERVLEAARILDIEDYLNRKPKQLSGGQRQRVALGRAIVRKARIFLMDEPLSNLDAKLRVQMRSELIRLHKEIKTTTIYVTHDQTEAMTMADRVVVMSKGYIQQIGTPYEIYKHPANKFVASFVGSPAMNFINAKLTKNTLEFSDGFTFKLEKEQVEKINEFYKVLLPIKEKELEEAKNIVVEENPTNKKAKKVKEEKEEKIQTLTSEIETIKLALTGVVEKMIFGVRPESIKLSNDKKAFEKKVNLLELLGDEYYVHMDFGGKDILAKISSENIINAGDTIKLSINSKNIHLFDPITKNTIL